MVPSFNGNARINAFVIICVTVIHLIHAIRCDEPPGPQQAAAEEIAASVESPTKATAEAAAGSAADALLVRAGIGELYVRLLCAFEPAAVLPFLQVCFVLSQHASQGKA